MDRGPSGPRQPGLGLRWVPPCAGSRPRSLIAATCGLSSPNSATPVRDTLSARPAVAALFGLALGAGDLTCLRATLSPIGIAGTILIPGILGALLRLLFSASLRAFGNPVLNRRIGTTALSLIRAGRMPRSVICRRISGTVEVGQVGTT
jgi:hypothetical protein